MTHSRFLVPIAAAVCVLALLGVAAPSSVTVAVIDSGYSVPLEDCSWTDTGFCGIPNSQCTSATYWGCVPIGHTCLLANFTDYDNDLCYCCWQ